MIPKGILDNSGENKLLSLLKNILKKNQTQIGLTPNFV